MVAYRFDSRREFDEVQSSALVKGNVIPICKEVKMYRVVNFYQVIASVPEIALDIMQVVLGRAKKTPGSMEIKFLFNLFL